MIEGFGVWDQKAESTAGIEMSVAGAGGGAGGGGVRGGDSEFKGLKVPNARNPGWPGRCVSFGLCTSEFLSIVVCFGAGGPFRS